MHFENKVVVRTTGILHYCGQMAGRMKTPLGMEVDLHAGHIVLDGFPALRERHTAPPLLDPCLLWPRSPISATAELVFVQLCSSWQDFNWLKGSRSLSAAAELLVKYRDAVPWTVQKWLHQDAVCDVDSSRSKEVCIRLESQWRKFTQPGEYDWTVHVRRRCSLMSTHFDHLLRFSVSMVLCTHQTQNPKLHLNRYSQSCKAHGTESHICFTTGHPSHPSKLPLRIEDLDLHLIHGSLDTPKSITPATCRPVQPFCRAHERDRQTDHAILSVTIGRIYVVLRCDLKTVVTWGCPCHSRSSAMSDARTDGHRAMA